MYVFVLNKDGGSKTKLAMRPVNSLYYQRQQQMAITNPARVAIHPPLPLMAPLWKKLCHPRSLLLVPDVSTTRSWWSSPDQETLLSNVEEEETARFMSDPRAKVATDHTMPVRLKLGLKGGLHQLCDSSFIEWSFEGTFSLPDGVLSHLLIHMVHFDHSSSKGDPAFCLIGLHSSRM